MKKLITSLLVIALTFAIGGTVAFIQEYSDSITNQFELSEITYIVNYNTNKEYVNTTNNVEIQKNFDTNTVADLTCNFELIDNPILEGYVFSGWYYDKECTELAADVFQNTIDLDFNTPNDINKSKDIVEVTLYAKWENGTYTINFNSNGGTGSMQAQAFDVGESGFLYANNFSREGYEFIGWAFSEDKDAVVYTDKQWMSNIPSSGSVTLYAVWSKGQIVVTFDTGYDEIQANPAIKTVIFDEEYGSLPTVAIEGYRFLGWYTNKEGGTKVTADTVVTDSSNHKLYAHWETPDVDLLLMFDGSGTNNFTSFAKHDYEYEKAIIYTGQSKQGAWESFSIRMSNLIVGGTYQLKFDAALSDRSCIRDGGDNTYPIGCKVDEVPRYAQVESTEVYDWVPTSENKSTKGYVIEFVATKDTMFWLWELSKIRNPGEVYGNTWVPGVENFEESYFDLILDNISLTLVDGDIEFENISAPSDNVASFKRNSYTNTSVDFNVTGGGGKYEKVNIPISKLIIGETYTVNFELESNATGGVGTYHFGFLIGDSKITSNDNSFGSSIRVWNGDSFIQGSGTRKTSGSFTFTATTSDMWWTWDLTCINNGTSYNFNINATISSASAAASISTYNIDSRERMEWANTSDGWTLSDLTIN